MSEQLHVLKTVDPFYSDIVSGAKRFEVRKNDRDFQAGDLLLLVHYDPHREIMLDSYVKFRIDYVLTDYPGIEKGYCIMSLSRVIKPKTGKIYDSLNRRFV
jgi:ParB family chromosome partitioning protein